ncbi:MAG: Rrf2 family transcriptional regulator [Phycisphaerales bacterium]|nr:MAG: Rrf2 family transcriptional regulator [Phycisphaerales bacterium]
MLSLTRKTDYALAALVDLAKKGLKTASARDLAERLNVPQRALTNTLNRLTHRGLVESVRGVGGGYKLARLPSDISLAELIEAVEGPISLTRCCAEELEEIDRGCDRIMSCDVRASINKLHERLKEFLSQVTLEELALASVPAEVADPTTDSQTNGEPPNLDPEQSG